jgi:alpha-L-fucosidase
MPTGEIEPRQVARLKEMGEWLAKYGQSIYATRGGPFKPGPWGASTYKGDMIYVHVYPQDKKDQVVKLPPIGKKIVGSELLTGGTCEVKQTDKSIEIAIPAADVKEIDTLVALKLYGPAADIKPVRVASMSDSVSLDKPARASNVHQKQAEYGADKAFDDDPGTRWATDAGTHSAWIEVDLGKETIIDRAMISESCGDRVQKFELQSKEGDEYKTFFKGTTIGEKKQLKFDPVKVRIVRLNILEATEGPTIWEIQLFAPKP